jgi:hypothetical protein
MTNYRFQVTLPYFTNMPSDVITNDWCFSWLIGTPSESNFDAQRDNLTAFYEAIYQIGAGDNAGAPWVSWDDARLKVYNIGDTPPRAPVYESDMPIDIAPNTDSTTPLECAVCLSFQGDAISGVPQARRRGRIFLGGWANIVDPGDDTSFPQITSIVPAGIASEANTLATASTADAWIWSVYSRVNGTATAVTNGWVDNELDTQRRRQVAATSRTVFP